MEATINFQLLRKAARVFDLPCLHSSVWLSTPSSTSSLIHPELILSLCRQRVRDMIMNELADECLMVYLWNVSGPTQRPTTHTHLMMKHDPYNEVNQNSVDDLLQTPNLGIDWFLAKDPPHFFYQGCGLVIPTVCLSVCLSLMDTSPFPAHYNLYPWIAGGKLVNQCHWHRHLWKGSEQAEFTGINGSRKGDQANYAK